MHVTLPPTHVNFLPPNHYTLLSDPGEETCPGYHSAYMVKLTLALSDVCSYNFLRLPVNTLLPSSLPSSQEHEIICSERLNFILDFGL